MPLYIRVPNERLLPRNGPRAVLEATVGGGTARIELTLVAPALFADAEPTYLYEDDHTTPQWLEVDAAYAGEARELSEEEYRQVLRDWWFAQGGLTYNAQQKVRLRNGFSETMENLWTIYRGLMWLNVVHPHLCTNLMYAVHNRHYSQDELRQLRDLVPALAQLLLYRDDRFVDDFLGSVVMNFVNMHGTTFDLCLPWARGRAT